MKTSKIIFIIFLLIFALMFLFSINIKASDDINTEDYKTTLQSGEASSLFGKAKVILSILRTIAVMVAVISLSILGIKYMVGSVDEKAAYKEKLMPIVIGALLITSLGSILIGIGDIMNNSTGHGGGGGGPSTTMVELQ